MIKSDVPKKELHLALSFNETVLSKFEILQRLMRGTILLTYLKSQYVDSFDIVEVETGTSWFLTRCLLLCRGTGRVCGLGLSLGWGAAAAGWLPFLLGNGLVHLDHLSVEAISCLV